MTAKTTKGIEIIVETVYQEAYSSPINREFMFAYKIIINNFNSFSVKLLSRFWEIIDAFGEIKTVEGQGVVGVQPIINSGASYQYISGTNFKTEMGKMRGTYTFLNLNNQQEFEVEIPEFFMEAPIKLN